MHTKMAGPAHFCTFRPKNTLNLRQKLPDRLVNISTLTLLERDLIRTKKALRPGTPLHLPFWFLARMERDIFLWKNRLSVADAEHFDFWLDPVRLAIKRLRALKSPHHLEAASADATKLERRYVKSVIKALLPKLPIIQALTQKVAAENDSRPAVWLLI